LDRAFPIFGKKFQDHVPAVGPALWLWGEYSLCEYSKRNIPPCRGKNLKSLAPRYPIETQDALGEHDTRRRRGVVERANANNETVITIAFA
jgi:hypothetical protein